MPNYQKITSPVLFMYVIDETYDITVFSEPVQNFPFEEMIFLGEDEHV